MFQTDVIRIMLTIQTKKINNPDISRSMDKSRIDAITFGEDGSLVRIACEPGFRWLEAGQQDQDMGGPFEGDIPPRLSRVLSGPVTFSGVSGNDVPLQVVYVVSGKAIFYLQDGTEQESVPGDVTVVPSFQGPIRGLVVAGDEPYVVLSFVPENAIDKIPRVKRRTIKDPNITRKMTNSKVEIVNLGELGAIMWLRYDPGFRWSENVRPGLKIGQSFKDDPPKHIAYVISGKAISYLQDGTERESPIGEVTLVPPFHGTDRDLVVVGDEPYVVVTFIPGNYFDKLLHKPYVKLFASFQKLARKIKSYN